MRIWEGQIGMDSQSLKKKTLAGIIWKFMERFCAQGISLAVSIVLARLLGPDDYAPISIITIFFAFANIFISGGLNTALMQKKDAEKEDYSTVFTFSLVVAVLLYAVFFLLAPQIAGIYKQPILIPVFRVMSLVLIINAAKSVLCAYISSHLLFKKFFFSTLGGTLISAIVGIIMAANGFGVWSLVAQQLTNSTIDTLILFLTTGVRFSIIVSIERLKEMFRFGFKMLVASFISTLYEEISPLVIGIKFTPSDLSYYEKGRSFPSLINSAFNDSISAVIFPAMAKVQDDKNMVLSFTRRFIQLSSFLIFPLMIGFLVVSDQFTITVLSGKWMGASIYIKIFCLCYLFNIIQNGNLQAIKAIGRSDIVLKLEIIKKSLYFGVLIMAILISKSPVVIAAAAVINTVIATVVNTFPNRKLIGYSYRLQISDLLPNMIIALVMGVIVYTVGLYVYLSEPLKLLLQVLIGFIVYVGMAVVTHNASFFYIVSLVKNFKRKHI